MSASDGSAEGSESWAEIARGSCRLASDAAWVVGLRSLRLARGGRPALREAALMVTEKWYAHAAYARALATGQLGRSPGAIAAGTIAYFGIWVADNRRRLTVDE